MVAAPRRVEGKVRLGCLIAVAVLVLAGYLVKDVGSVYWRYYQLQDEVKAQAGFAPALTDKVILERLVARADTLGLPIGPRAWTVRRSASPPTITIRGAYDDSIVIAVIAWRKVFHVHFTPGIEAPL